MTDEQLQRFVSERKYPCVKCGALPYDRLINGSAICERCRVQTTKTEPVPLVVSFDAYRGSCTVTLRVEPEVLRYVNEDGRTKIKEWLEQVKTKLHQRLLLVDPPLVSWKH